MSDFRDDYAGSILWRIRLPDVLSINTSFTFPSRRKSAVSTDKRLLARCQLPFLIASATASKVGSLALWG